MEVPFTSTCIPAAHEAWSTQYVLPAWPWNWLALHEEQMAAFATFEYLPAEQSMHVLSAVPFPVMAAISPAEQRW
jgi:hypothetical protein